MHACVFALLYQTTMDYKITARKCSLVIHITELSNISKKKQHYITKPAPCDSLVYKSYVTDDHVTCHIYHWKKTLMCKECDKRTQKYN